MLAEKRMALFQHQQRQNEAANRLSSRSRSGWELSQTSSAPGNLCVPPLCVSCARERLALEFQEAFTGTGQDEEAVPQGRGAKRAPFSGPTSDDLSRSSSGGGGGGVGWSSQVSSCDDSRAFHVVHDIVGSALTGGRCPAKATPGWWAAVDAYASRLDVGQVNANADGNFSPSKEQIEKAGALLKLLPCS